MGDIRVVLTWGPEPHDLDAHLSGPICDTTERFHVSYLAKNGSPPVSYADLDWDDANGYGPETITMRPANGGWLPGEYDFWVHNVFSGAPDFGVSSAVVTVFQGDTQVDQYSVADEPGVETTTLDIWRVVNLMVDELGTLTVNREAHGFLKDWDGANYVPPPVTPPTVVSCPPGLLVSADLGPAGTASGGGDGSDALTVVLALAAAVPMLAVIPVSRLRRR